MATPRNSATAPHPTASSRRPVARAAGEQHRRASARSTRRWSLRAPAVPKRAKRDGGSTEPSRTAAIGATRVERSAGRIAASIVTITPTSSETMIVRALNTMLVCGRSMPNETNSAFRPLASANPRNRPTTEASSPITNASMSTDASTCRRVAPSVRSVASSRVRCATVIDSVLAITKLPTNSATPPNASRKSWKIREEAARVLRGLLGLRGAGPDLGVGGEQAADRGHQRRARVTRVDGHVDLVVAALLGEDALCRGQREDRQRGAAERGNAGEFDRPGDREALDRTAGDHADLSVRAEKCCLLAVAASMSTSPGCVGHPPLDRLSGLKRWFCRRVAEAEPGRAAAGDRPCRSARPGARCR